MKNTTTHYLRILSTLILLCFGGNLLSHSVQVAYCISCTGQLRLYVEHWHGGDPANSTQMTIEYNDGSGVQTITGSPIANLQNLTIGQLPGCIAVPITFGTCPGDANTFNDWVYYDFLNPPPNVPITITIISGSNAFTQDCGGMYPASITFTIPPISNVSETVPSQITCHSSNFGAVTFTTAGINNWTNDNPSIGIPASGTGNIASFTAINNTNAIITANITFTNGCNTGTFQLSVKPAPNASFTFPLSSSGDHEDYCKNNAINFSLANSTGVTTVWDFGDGNSSTSLNPSHTYSTVGSYSVSVILTAANSCTSTSTIPLSVYTPTANFTTANNCLNVSSSFTNTSTSPQAIAAYVWNFGSSNGTGAMPSVIFPTSGTKSVTLTIAAVDGCTATVTKPITIYSNPVVSFTAPSVCNGFASNFVNNSSITAPDNISTWGWDFENDAVIDNTTQNPSFTFPNSGVFNVALTATSNNGCVTTSVVSVKVNEDPTAAFAPTEVCENAFVAMNNTSSILAPFNIVLYEWNFGAGASSTTSSNQHPNNVFYSTYGIKTITLKITANTSCTATATQTVMINPLPNPNFTFVNKCVNAQPTTFDAASSSLPLGVNNSYTWAFGDGNTAPNSITTTHNYALAGNYNTTLTVTTDKGCVLSISKQIEVYEKPILSISSSTVCFKVTMSFTAVSSPLSGNVINWIWDFNNNIATTEGVGQTPTFNFSTEGTQTVVVIATTERACVETYTKTVYVNYLPKPDFSVDDPDGCADHCVVFSNATPALTTPAVNANWKWILGDGAVINASNSSNKSHCYKNETTNQVKNYDVKLIVTSSVGCKDSISKNSFITVYPNPVASFTYVPELGNVSQPQVYFVNQSIDYTNWAWNFGDASGEDSTQVNPKHFYDTEDATSYYTRLIVRNQYGCKDTAFAKVDIGPEFIFYIPNAFSPLNEDGINDVFKGVGIGVAKYEMWVYNRWGTTVFYSDELMKGWNGKIQGQENVAKQDVYTWKVKLKDVFGKDHEYVGHVTLLK